LFKKLKAYKNTFSKVKISQLLAFKEGDYIIKLIGENPLYRFIYNLFKLKFKEFRRYIDNTITRKIIRLLISLLKALIIFILKKDGILRLYVNYKSLNVIIKRNKYLFPLIMETLNRLSGVKRFIKLNLIKAYYRIRIREGNK